MRVALRLFKLAVLLTVFSAVGALGYWLCNAPQFSVYKATIHGDLGMSAQQEVRRVLGEQCQKDSCNIVLLDIQDLSNSLREIDWVKRVDVLRVWPNALSVSIERHRPVALWEDGRLVSSSGDLFKSIDASIDTLRELPTFSGDVTAVTDMLREWKGIREICTAGGAEVRVLHVSFRGSWSVVLGFPNRADVMVELGRQEVQDNNPVEQLRRVMLHFNAIVAHSKQPPSVIDARYKDGFSVRYAEPTPESVAEPGPTTTVQGKEPKVKGARVG